MTSTSAALALLYCLSCLSKTMLVSVVAQQQLLQVQILAPGFVNTPMPSTITLCGLAYATGVEHLNQIYYTRMNFSYTYLFDEATARSCDGFTFESTRLISQWLYQTRDPESLTVIVSPSCTNQPIYISQIATQWNILLITSTQSDYTIRDKSLAPTWITTNIYPAQHYGDAMYTFTQANNWTSVYLVEEDGPTLFYGLMGPEVKRNFETKGIQFVYLKYPAWNTKRELIPLNFGPLLREFNARSRVMLFFAPAGSLRTLLIQAHAANMTSAEYVYVAAISFLYKRYTVFNWSAGDENDLIVHRAYRSVIMFQGIDLSQDNSTNLTSYVSRWTEFYRSDPFYRNQDLKDDPPTPFLAATQAGIEILGQILNETMVTEPAFDLRDGTALARKSWNRTFDTTTGRISLDQYGDRRPFTSLAYFDGSKFEVYCRSDFSSNAFQWKTVRPLKWHGGSRFPPNEPYCGFDGLRTRCQLRGQNPFLTAILITVAGVLLLICLFVMYVAIVRQKNRDMQWFVIQSTDLSIEEPSCFDRLSLFLRKKQNSFQIPSSFASSV